MQSILARLVDKITQAEVDPLPTDNIYMENLFTPEMYAEILARMPRDNDYDFIEHPDAILPDGRKTRKLLDLTDITIANLTADNQNFWHQMKAVLVSDELIQALIKKFQDKLTARYGTSLPEFIMVPVFYRDYPGYRISEHTDAPYKILTMQLYLPNDESQIHLGTTFHLKQGHQFHHLKTNPFKPNSGYAFVRTDDSWHSVKQLGDNESVRNSIALTLYKKGYEYKSNKGSM